MKFRANTSNGILNCMSPRNHIQMTPGVSTWTKPDPVVLSFAPRTVCLHSAHLTSVPEEKRRIEEMSKLLFLHTPHITSRIHTKTFCLIVNQTLSPFPLKYRLLYSSPLSTAHSNLHALSQIHSIRRCFSLHAFDDSPSDAKTQQEQQLNEVDTTQVKSTDETYPSGEFEFEKYGAWKSFNMKLRMLIAFPWERIRKGSVLTMKLRGQVCFLDSSKLNFVYFTWLEVCLFYFCS